MRGLRGLVALAAAGALAAAEQGGASEPLLDADPAHPTLKVNRKGEALVEYVAVSGRRRHVLVWGAVNARPPDASMPQVRFRYDFTGGWRKYRRLVWRRFRNSCRPYDGPPLPLLVAACKAPDGSYWALQRWQRQLPLLGFEPWLPGQAANELHVSHWRGPLPVLEVYANWTYGFAAQGVFGRLTYLGAPAYGVPGSGADGRRGRYGRYAYVDTLDSALGSGWRRAAAKALHRPNGAFCYSFVPLQPPPGYPSAATRPPGHGARHRVTVMGPGVLPVVSWEGPPLPQFDASNPAHVSLEEHANTLFDRLLAGDRVCARER